MSPRFAPALPRWLIAASLTVAVASAQEAEFRLDGDATRGGPIFLKKCKGCHGESGRGDGALAENLDPPPGNLTDAEAIGRYTDEQLYRLIRDGGEAVGRSSKMPGWSKLATDQQIRDLAAFVRTLAAPAD